MTSERHFGLTGLATMGANLARNVVHHGIPVAVHNRTASRTKTFIEEHGSEGRLEGYETVPEWVKADPASATAWTTPSSWRRFCWCLRSG